MRKFVQTQKLGDDQGVYIGISLGDLLLFSDPPFSLVAGARCIDLDSDLRLAGPPSSRTRPRSRRRSPKERPSLIPRLHPKLPISSPGDPIFCKFRQRQ